MRIISRYAHQRKLFDHSAKRYTNFNKLLDMINQGTQFVVYDSAGIDVTKETVAHAMCLYGSKHEAFRKAIVRAYIETFPTTVDLKQS